MAKSKQKKSGGELLELAKETTKTEQYWILAERSKLHKPPKEYKYIEELTYLQIELIKMQEWMKNHRRKMCVVFEGRDAAGKGGVIKRITDQPAGLPCRRPCVADRARTRAMVFSTLCLGIAVGRGNRSLRS